MQSNKERLPVEEIYPYTAYKDYPLHFERLKWIFRTIEQKTGSQKIKVLDVGCGTGNVTIPLGLLKNTEIHGIDIHQPTIDIALKANTFQNVKIEFLDLLKCPIGDYDFIILTEVLEHIPHYHDILDYLGKNMKKGGHLLITIPNGRGPFELSQFPLYLMRKIGLNNFIWSVKKLLGKKEPYSQNYETPHVNFFTIPRLRRELKTYGLEMKKMKKAYFIAPILETYLPFIPLNSLAPTDNAFIGILPDFMASGWYFDIEKV